MSTKLALHKQLDTNVAALLLASDHELKQVVSEYGNLTFADGKPSGKNGAGFAVQLAVQTKKLMGKTPEEYTDADAKTVIAIKARITEWIRRCNASPLSISKRDVKDKAYAIIKAHATEVF